MPTPEIRAAIELAHWRGEVDRWKEDSGKRDAHLDTVLAAIDSKLDAQGEELTKIKIKFALMAAAGNVVFGLIVAFGAKALGI